MLDQGVYTTLAQYIKTSLQSPLSLSIEMLKRSNEQLMHFMQAVVRDFLKSTTLVQAAFIGDTQKGLMYYVVLKDDTTEHREKFFDFLDEYEYLGIDSLLPIHFQFLPEQANDHFKEEQKIV